jgi:hypothetical protein
MKMSVIVALTLLTSVAIADTTNRYAEVECGEITKVTLGDTIKVDLINSNSYFQFSNEPVSGTVSNKSKTISLTGEEARIAPKLDNHVGDYLCVGRIQDNKIAKKVVQVGITFSDAEKDVFIY